MFIPLSYIFFTLMGGVKVHATRYRSRSMPRDTSDGDEEDMDEFIRKTNNGEGPSSNRHEQNMNSSLDDIIKQNGQGKDKSKTKQDTNQESPYQFKKQKARVTYNLQKDHVEPRVTKRPRHEDDEDNEDYLETPIYKRSTLYEMVQSLFTQFTSKEETPSMPTLAGGGKNDLDQFSTFPNDILKLTYKTRNLMSQLETSLYSTGNFSASKFDEIKRSVAAMSRLTALNIRSLYMASTQPNLTTHLGHAMSMAAYAYKDNAPSTLKDPKEDDRLWPEDATFRESWPMEKNRSYAQQAAASLGITFRNGFNDNHRSSRPRFNPNQGSPFPFGSTFDSNQGGIIPAPPPRHLGGGSFPVNFKQGGAKRHF